MKSTLFALLLAVAVFAAAGCAGDDSASVSATAPGTVAPTSAVAAPVAATPATTATAVPSTTVWVAPLVRLAALRVEPEAEGYDRDLFGSGWSDADGDGCDTRREVLIAQAVEPPFVVEGCELIAGEWLSMYDLEYFTDSSGLDVDHFLPLSEVWQSGAHRWSDQQRRDLYNDMSNPDFLIAVSAPSNRSKGDRSPHEWIPQDSGLHCWYAQTWVELKTYYDLAVDETERDGLEIILADC